MQIVTFIKTRSEILDRIIDEVSRLATLVYNESGISLFDTVALHTGDYPLVQRFVDDAVNALLSRTKEIEGQNKTQGEQIVLEFSPSSIIPGAESVIDFQILSFIVTYACAMWFTAEAPTWAEPYSAKSSAALVAAVNLLHTTAKPKPNRA